jgi:hypothetical protein
MYRIIPESLVNVISCIKQKFRNFSVWLFLILSILRLLYVAVINVINILTVIIMPVSLYRYVLYGSNSSATLPHKFLHLSCCYRVTVELGKYFCEFGLVTPFGFMTWIDFWGLCFLVAGNKVYIFIRYWNIVIWLQEIKDHYFVLVSNCVVIIIIIIIIII